MKILRVVFYNLFLNLKFSILLPTSSAHRDHLIYINMINGKILYILRCIKGMKQSEVARKLKISQQAYSKLERAELLHDDRLDNILAALRSSREEVAEIKRIFKI